jgi:hypothetical protein
MRLAVLVCLVASLASPARAQSRPPANLSVDRCPADALPPDELQSYLQLEDEDALPDVEVRCEAANELQIVLRQGERVWTGTVWLGDTPRERWPRVVALAVTELLRTALEVQPRPPPQSLTLILPPLAPPSPAPPLSAEDHRVMNSRDAGLAMLTLGTIAILGGVALFEIIANNEDVMSPIGQAGMALGSLGGAFSAVGAGLMSRRLSNEPIDRRAHATAVRTAIGLGVVSLGSVIVGSILVGAGRNINGSVYDGTFGSVIIDEQQQQQRHALYSGSVALYGVAALSAVGSGVAAALAARHPVRPYTTLTSDRRGLTVGFESRF